MWFMAGVRGPDKNFSVVDNNNIYPSSRAQFDANLCLRVNWSYCLFSCFVICATCCSLKQRRCYMAPWSSGGRISKTFKFIGHPKR